MTLEPGARNALRAMFANEAQLDNFLSVSQISSAQAQRLAKILSELAQRALQMAPGDARVRMLANGVYAAVTEVLTYEQVKRLRQAGSPIFSVYEVQRHEDASDPINPSNRAKLLMVMSDPGLDDKANNQLLDRFLFVSQLNNAQAEQLTAALSTAAKRALEIEGTEPRARFLARQIYEALTEILTDGQEQRLRDSGSVIFLMHEKAQQRVTKTKAKASGGAQAWVLGGLGALGLTALLFARNK